MRFFHLSDLHIGRQLHQYNLKEEQRAVLKEIVSYAEQIHPDAVIIAGDIYDKSVPSAEAVTIFDEFLTDLSGITPGIPLLIISGNHDSAERLEYAASILKKYDIYLAGSAPKDSSEHISRVTLKDQYGEVDFYLLPFLKPSYVRHVFEEDAPDTYNEAVRMLIKREGIDYQNRRNVLVSHQFYVHGTEETSVCDSEILSVGGLDQVDVQAVRAFDYVALGHLHGAQCVGDATVRYCGTPLKYSVSEWKHKKSLTVVTLGEKGTETVIDTLPFHPLRDVKKKTGTLETVMGQALEEEKDDYVSITLTDEADPYKPKEQLQKVYSHILELRMDNARTRKKLAEMDTEIRWKDPMTAFADFYRDIQGKDLTEEQTDVVKEVFDKAKGEL